MDSKKIGAFIKELRQANNMSQSDLAELIPINREAISKWECGRTIPDSSTIIRLSDIFGVSIDEIIYGEYKTKENNNNVENVQLQVLDDRNETRKKLRKTSQILMISLIILTITITGFLIYYFFNTYESVKIYTIQSESDNISISDGLLVLTGENIYFRLGIIKGIDENEISRVSVYYAKEDREKIVYEDSSPKDYIIRDYYGYNEYFEIKDKEIVFDSLFVDIHLDNEIKTLKLIIKEEYSNKRFFYRKLEPSAVEKGEVIKPLDNELTQAIKEYLKNEESGIYHNKIKKDKITYDAYYIDDTSELLLQWQNGEFVYSLQYFPEFEDTYYSKGDSNLSNTDECRYNKNNPSKTTCDDEIISILNSLINEITKGRS